MDKKTPFYNLHKSHNAKLVSFAGYVMPIQYKGVNFEHNHVRNDVGIFDVSHMAQIAINGANAFDLVQKLTTNDVSKLTDGKAQYSCMLNQYGGIIDDLLVYRISLNSYMLVVNASNATKDFNWISSNNHNNVSVVNITDSNALLSVQGPKSIELLQKYTHIELKDIPYYSFKIGDFSNCQDVIISKTGYTGCLGFELYIKREFAEKVWVDLFDSNHILEPIGLAARDTLRLEMGYCLYGNDINEEISPLEAGLSWIVKMNTDFIGKKALSTQISEGLKKCLVGFLMEERGIPRKGYDILNNNGNIIGSVTSGTMSPSLKRGLGMGYVTVKEAHVDNSIFISIRDKKIAAKIVKRPFYEK